MSSVELQKITKRFKYVTALEDVSFMVHDREFFVLLGPTGAGKTSTLRIIAALLKQDSGSVLFDGEVVDGLTPADRDVAFVFQQYSLYPTMTVYDNLAFPLRSPLRKTPEDEIKTKVEHAAEILRISHLLDRKTAKLSGGEMQRVSIGRAIVREPRMFLMDEPLSNLDAKLRESLRVELQHMQKTQGNTTLFVTHDQIEALTMADRIGVLNEGRLIQVGTPVDIYDRPATTFVAQLVGTPRINLLPAGRENGTIHVDESLLQMPAPEGRTLPDKLLVGIRPEDISLNPTGQFNGTVVLTEPLGVETIVHVQSGERTLLSLAPGMIHLQRGADIRFNLLQDRLHFFDETGKRIA
ncbi:MAG: ABC transporter ATP-binding protein [Anaerolineae bacterium]|nr:ABC transporter ATP-binding protein [Anaerolineae bacterium]MCB9133666.1 ABC transporter ATP-binding protein [Anaerolineales bacterium]MCB0233770.1 ABC transporter ATP-binding protein [Anaerolineae bacterium]MCB0249071.1 ABC transporter ATP-binding protein [Anaerolineae bacterium]MCB9141130.1 ABC transporter ATP-binding protein [Anaerolineales bacterium]